MAEFVQTMKDWKRMCNSMGQEDEYNACKKCGLQSFDCPAIYEKESDGADWDRVEKVVTAWAAEHQEPVYPTWGEWLHDKGIILDARQHNEIEHWILGLNAMKPIPADIAQKLGIEPKEGHHARI